VKNRDEFHDKWQGVQQGFSGKTFQAMGFEKANAKLNKQCNDKDKEIETLKQTQAEQTRFRKRAEHYIAEARTHATFFMKKLMHEESTND